MMNYIKNLFGKSNNEFINSWEQIRDSESIHKERMANMVTWLKELRIIRNEGFSITNSDTQDAIDIKMYRDERGELIQLMYRQRNYKVILNGKCVFELNASDFDEFYAKDTVIRFNYGSWYHDVEELYTTQMDMAECARQAKHDALFAPLDE